MPELGALIAMHGTLLVAAALESTPRAAFLVNRARVLHANQAAMSLFQSDGELMSRLLSDLIRRADEPSDPALAQFNVTKFQSEGHGALFLLVAKGNLPVPEARFESAARGWGLTRRQTQVLKEIVRGSSTKTIADALGCAHRTAQLHVSAILRKSGCKTRPALVAHFWSAL